MFSQMSQRVNINGEVRPYNKYFCNSWNAKNTVYETWSSTKVFAAANAGSTLRKGSPTCSPRNFGLDAKVWGKNGYTQLADLVTAVVSYDETAGYSSNGLSGTVQMTSSMYWIQNSSILSRHRWPRCY